MMGSIGTHHHKHKLIVKEVISNITQSLVGLYQCTLRTIHFNRLKPNLWRRNFMKRLYFVLAVLLVASMALTACGAGAGAAPAVCKTDAGGCAVFTSGQTVKIGMGAPMTGDNASFGQDISQGAKIAVSDAGKFQGFSFELDAQDDGGTAEGGASVANKLVADSQVVAIAGHIFSGATKAAMPIYEAANIPMMSPSATNPPLTTTGSKVFNRCVFTDTAQGTFASKYLYNKLGVKKLAILHDGQAYGQGLAKVVNDQFTKLGGTVVAFNAITPGESDYSAALADLASKKPDALFYGGYVAEAVVIVNEMKQAGLTGVTFFGDDGTFGQDFLDRTGANGEGAYSTSLIPPASAAKTKFDAAYLAAYGQPAGKLSPYSWTAYDSAAVLIKAIESVAVLSGGKLYVPRAALVAAVRGTKDYQGLSGTITCDATGECSASGPVFNIDKGGKWVEAPK
jgi:branched-chain amino acid transport system substrate-binding protein